MTFRPIGISPSIEPSIFGTFDGNQWPPVSPPLKPDKQPASPNDPLLPLSEIFEKAPVTAFPHRAWSSYHFSIVVLCEFVQVKTADGKFWHDIEIKAPPVEQALYEQIDELIALIEYRRGVLTEALIQRDAFLDYFQGILSFTRSSHPSTFNLAHIALRVGQFVVMHFKHRYRVPRPSYLAPALMPPIAVPGHAAYPSGHATEAWLVAHCLKEVMPKEAYDRQRLEASPLDRLAERIARNREVLGLHYPCDSEAGKELAGKIFPLLMECPSLKSPGGLVEAAHKEWKLEPLPTGDPAGCTSSKE